MSRRARPAKCDGGRHHNTHVRLVAEVHGPLGESGTGSRDGGTHRMSVPCKGVTREHWSGAGGQH